MASYLWLTGLCLLLRYLVRRRKRLERESAVGLDMHVAMIAALGRKQ